MASSRWKRFAFFDRHTLNIPNEVVEDVVPRAPSSSNLTAQEKQSQQSQQQQQQQRPTEEAVSLVVTTAGLPLATRPSLRKKSAADAAAGGGNNAAASDNNNNNNSNAEDMEQAVSAMWSSLVTCSTTNYECAVVSGEGGGADIAGSSVSFPNASNTSGSGNNNNSNTIDTNEPPMATAMDGLVLAFLSSPETDFVHCIDVTVRCNPPLMTATASAALPAAAGGDAAAAPGTTAATTTEAAGAVAAPTNATERDLEDMDGWRGYVGPFAASAAQPQQQQQQQQAEPGSGEDASRAIRDLAVCRISNGSGSGEQQQQQQQQQHNAIHLACLSKNKCVVWQDPHLYLSCRRPLMSPKIPAHAKVWQLPISASAPQGQQQQQQQQGGSSSGGASSATVDGEFTAVSLVAGLVAIGTNKGAVLIYVYNPTSNNNKSLRRYLRIPPPLGEPVQVTSLKVSETTATPGEESGASGNNNNSSSSANNKISVFVVYNRSTGSGGSAGQAQQQQQSQQATGGGAATPTTSSTGGAAAGICCYDVPKPASAATSLSISAPSARHDLDVGRYVASRRLLDAASLGATATGPVKEGAPRLVVARPDGLYTYSPTERVSVSPIDGNKLTVALIPHAAAAAAGASSGNNNNTSAASSTAPSSTGAASGGQGVHTSSSSSTYHGRGHRRPLDSLDEPTATLGYALLASTDEKSGRDAVDVYDSTNKLVAFHLLLSPGHRAVRAAGVSTPATVCSDGNTKGGRSSALVFTSGGSIVTLTEKRTAEKVDLLIQKNLFSAAVVVAYADPAYPASEISILYRRYAEHLYRKGDLSGAVDQYIHTIGSLESSHVIFRFLDAPKIPLLVKYLTQLRQRGRSTPVHDELLRTCYLKLNDAEAAEAIASTAMASTVNRTSLTSVLSNLLSTTSSSPSTTNTNPHKEALSTICALEAPEAVDILVIHGASLARALPHETAGVVIALCVGTFSPRSLAMGNSGTSRELREMLELNSTSASSQEKACEPYPVELFASAFIEQPKMLRLILSHCNRNKCPLTPALRRTLLELTLDEWNQAKRTGDTEALKLRHKEAMAALTDSHSREIGDYDALVICQLAGFEEGQLLLYERLSMTPMLLERYAKDGTEKARRQMLAMCQTDPDILPEVLGFFVAMASERLAQNSDDNKHLLEDMDDGSFAEETEELLDDIQATLALARRQGTVPPVRIARILAGEGTGQFTAKTLAGSNGGSGGGMNDAANPPTSTVPLSVALEYVGNILEESRNEGARLKAEVEDYNELCNSMEREIESLLRTSRGLAPLSDEAVDQEASMGPQQLNIDELYNRMVGDNSMAPNASNPNAATGGGPNSALPRETFWREMNQSDGGDSLETIARFFAKGVIR